MWISILLDCVWMFGDNLAGGLFNISNEKAMDLKLKPQKLPQN